MAKKAFSEAIEKRKTEHLRLALLPETQTGNTGLTSYRFIHNAIPEIDFDKIDTEVYFLNKKVSAPLFISCMTGGILSGGKLNKNLALAAEKYQIPMGVGSQRVAIENPGLSNFFEIRKYAPTIPLMANIGLIQLNYGFGLKEFQKCIQMIEADALTIHLNPIQEALQPEGDRNFENLLPKLEKIIKKISAPVILKEVGCGLSDSVIKRLYAIGVKYFDTAGWGGTSWPKVEGLRGKVDLTTAEVFGDWGIPTAESILMAAEFKRKHKDITILGSGGIRNGIEIAKCIAMGSDLVGIAAPFAREGLKSANAVEKLIEKYIFELKTTMFGVGAINIRNLGNIKLQKK